MSNAPRVVDHSAWLAARLVLLEKEKAFTKARDELSALRRALPWERVEQMYRFQGPTGETDLAGLFGACSQLIVYHFMLGADWEQGCPSCSFWADNFNGAVVHLAHRDTQLVAVSRAPLTRIETYKRRMGWTFPWVSSAGCDFNVDYHVSASEAEKAKGGMDYNYALRPAADELPAISVFAKADDGNVVHTYSCYARGLDMLNGAYHLLDLTPKGRDEAGLPWPMAWVRRHDQYGA